MFNYKLILTKKPNAAEVSVEEICNRIDSYFSALLNNGQIISGYEVYSREDGSVCVDTVLLKHDSLDVVNNSEYAERYLTELREVSDGELVFEGNNLEYRKSCMCSRPSRYYLGNEHNCGESPLICGDCHSPVVLYEVPCIFGERERYSIKSWQTVQNSMDHLWFYGLWDKFIYGQIALPRSTLNREGRRIRRALEKALGVPVYYHIYHYEDEDDQARYPKLPYTFPKTCPICGGGWETEGIIAGARSADL